MDTDLNVVFGAGPMGRAITRQLLAEGCRVRLVSRAGTAPGLPGAEAWCADLLVPEAALAAAEGARTVFHCAAPAYSEWVTLFPGLQDNIVAAAAKAGAVLVVIENLYGYGVAGHLTEDMALTAGTRKGRVRAEMSHRLFEAHQKGRVRAVAGRASDFFGPGARVATLGERVFPRLLAGRRISWLGNPDMPHSFTYVPDFAAALIRLSRSPEAWGRAWHVPSPPVLTPRAVMARAAALAGAPAPRISPMPKPLLWGLSKVVPIVREVAETAYMFDSPFVMEHKAWDAAFGTRATPWDQALGATVEWWRSQGRVA
jgi:nucleoside-diphosphate-sugar epimerase